MSEKTDIEDNRYTLLMPNIGKDGHVLTIHKESCVAIAKFTYPDNSLFNQLVGMHIFFSVYYYGYGGMFADAYTRTREGPYIPMRISVLIDKCTLDNHIKKDLFTDWDKLGNFCI